MAVAVGLLIVFVVRANARPDEKGIETRTAFLSASDRNVRMHAPMRRGLKRPYGHQGRRSEGSVRMHAPMRRGLKHNFHPLGGRWSRGANARPDEKGIETLLGILPEFDRHRANARPDEKGIETHGPRLLEFLAGFLVRMHAPMRRGLKLQHTGCSAKASQWERANARPDEKGIETWLQVRTWRLRATVRMHAPMRRGLKRTRT